MTVGICSCLALSGGVWRMSQKTVRGYLSVVDVCVLGLGASEGVYEGSGALGCSKYSNMEKF